MRLKSNKALLILMMTVASFLGLQNTLATTNCDAKQIFAKSMDCVGDEADDEEKKLYQLINQYRAENNLPAIPLSPSLNLVANRHVRDLEENVGHLTHSWSDCDYKSDNYCMWAAPQRLGTQYPGKGYENAYASSGSATAEGALNSWKNSPAHNNVILNKDIWNITWKALGVGIYQGYAVIWFGEKDDPVPADNPPTEAPQLTVTPSELMFDQVKLNSTSAEQKITLTNSGNVELTNLEIATPQQAEFSQTSTTCQSTLAKGESCTVSITFQPTEIKEVTDLITVLAVGIETKMVMLTGTGKEDGATTSLPKISPVFALDSEGLSVSNTAQFFGGVAVWDDAAQPSNQNLTMQQTITIKGEIVPSQGHVGQIADILVLGLYVPPVNIVEDGDNCNPAKGDYYMNTEHRSYTDSYCNWDVISDSENGTNTDICNTKDNNLRKDKRTSDSYWQRWNGKLDRLKPLAEVTLTDKMVFDGSGDLPVLYKDMLNYSGHVCINFGYRLKENGMIIFNGEPIQYRVK